MIAYKKNHAFAQADIYFECGCRWWELKNPLEAEKWLRYAALQGHELARTCLKLGVEHHAFVCLDDQLDRYAEELLKHFITPAPDKNQVTELRSVLSGYFDKKYGLL